jgi:hypothetical protein
MRLMRFRASAPEAPAAHLHRLLRPGGALTAIKAVHTLIWLSIESCVVYVLYAGWSGRSDRRAARAAAVVAGEMAVFGANRCRCPLTDLAERAGAAHGSVTDIYLPRWFAHNLPAIHVPLILLAVHLHLRNLRREAPAAQPASGPAGSLTLARARSCRAPRVWVR